VAVCVAVGVALSLAVGVVVGVTVGVAVRVAVGVGVSVSVGVGVAVSVGVGVGMDVAVSVGVAVGVGVGVRVAVGVSVGVSVSVGVGVAVDVGVAVEVAAGVVVAVGVALSVGVAVSVGVGQLGVPTQNPRLSQVSPDVQGSPSLHEAPVFGVCVQTPDRSQASIVQAFWSSQSAAIVHSANRMQSDGSEFTVCEGYEHASMRRVLPPTTPKSSRSTAQSASVSFGNWSPAGKGSSGFCATSQMVLNCFTHVSPPAVQSALVRQVWPVLTVQ
jgi:hypothetical protein